MSLIPLSKYYYASKLSMDCMKLTVTKMHTFFIPPYLPDHLQVGKVSNDNLITACYRLMDECYRLLNECITVDSS